MSALLAVDDGLTNANFNAADIFFLIGLACAVISGIGYAAGIAAVARRTDDTPANGVPAVTTQGVPIGWHYHLHQWAAALLAFGVGSIAFGLFLL